MGQSIPYRERRNAIAAWLRDRFGPDDGGEMPDAAYWKDAADLLKFLRSNGFRIINAESDEDVAS